MDRSRLDATEGSVYHFINILCVVSFLPSCFSLLKWILYLWVWICRWLATNKQFNRPMVACQLGFTFNRGSGGPQRSRWRRGRMGDQLHAGWWLRRHQIHVHLQQAPTEGVSGSNFRFRHHVRHTASGSSAVGRLKGSRVAETYCSALGNL